MRVDILTIFPEMVEPYLNGSILGRGQKKKLLDLHAHNLRTWTSDRHQTVDDKPFGGGPGMLMKIEPFDKALKAIKSVKQKNRKTRVILTSAKGKTFTQSDAKRLAKYDRLIFLCGRYEGVDERVAQHLADEELSIGNYVMTGGELAALVMTDAIARLRPGVLGKEESLANESHDEEGVLEYPQYTRPEVYKKWKVPAVLLSGNHAKIADWRRAYHLRASSTHKTKLDKANMANHSPAVKGTVPRSRERGAK
ncbi:tRNA (guanosine(37)-N1)-methyltransferase TrmD [Candidatus Uhrbacteria bacterium]|nr:tRNA (guanosine(37)-N1)-methyltransferase TrmD [Candidatus Uhrbacteria bacterium]